jgi:hypothetical protein
MVVVLIQTVPLRRARPTVSEDGVNVLGPDDVGEPELDGVVSRSESLNLLNFRGMPLGELHFDDVKVPAGSALNVSGFAGMMEGINLARVDAANYACGFLKAAIRECALRTNNRVAFGKPLSELQTIQLKVAQMARLRSRTPAHAGRQRQLRPRQRR